MKKIITLFYLCLVAYFSPVQADIQPAFTTYQIENGLSSNTVWTAIQSKSGFMWFGTDGGLNRFDGHEFKIFRNTNVTGDQNPSETYAIVRSICEEKNGNLWIGYDNGVSRFDILTEKFTPFKPKTIHSSIQKIIIHKNGKVWIATREQGIFIYNPENDQLSVVAKSSKIIWDLSQDNSGKVYAATHQNGLSCFDENGNLLASYKKSNTLNNISDDDVKSTYIQDHILWIGTWKGGLNRLDLKSGKTSVFLSDIHSTHVPHIRTIAPYTQHKILLGTDEGVYVFDTRSNRCTPLDSPRQLNGLSDRSVYCITPDREGGIWISTFIGGINYLAPPIKPFETYSPFRIGSNFSGKMVTRFQEDKSGKIWISTEDGGLNLFDPITGHSTIYLPSLTKNSISYHNIRAIYIDDYNLWIGTFSKGLDCLNLKTGKFKNYQNIEMNPHSLSDNSIYSIFKDSRGILYIGTVWGLNRYNPQEDNFIRIKEVGFDSHIYDILETPNGDIWAASYNSGVFRYHQATKKWIHYSSLNQNIETISTNRTICLFVDHKERLWLGTRDAGLFKFNDKTENFEPYQNQKDLSNQSIYSIREDAKGYFWMGTSRGLIRMNPDRPGDLKIITKQDGIQGNQFNHGASLRTKNGKMYFGGTNGFSSFYPANILINQCTPTATITSLSIFSREVDITEKDSPLKKSILLTDKIELDYNQNMVGFSFSALSFNAPDKNLYAYRLQGADKDWIYTHNHQASYSNLPPGTYLFRVKAANNDGIWSLDEAQVTLVINPPFWRSIPAFFIYTILSLYGIFLALRWWYLHIDKINRQKLDELHQQKEKESYQSKINFFTQIAHDIRTPLTLIKAPLDIIISSGEGSARNRDMLSVIERNTDHLLSLVNQLLLLRKTEETDVIIEGSSLNIKELLTIICSRFEMNAELRKIEFTLQLPDQDVIAHVDKLFMDKILSNLLINALKFTKSKITIALRIENDYFTIEIKDNGDGIPEESKGHIFKPFYSSNHNDTGTGIGLALIKQLVEKQNGSVSGDNNPEGGACFTITLPLQPKNIIETEHPIPEKTMDRENMILNTERVSYPDISEKEYQVLIVEDNDDLRDFIATFLKSQFEVYTSRNGLEAIEILKQQNISLIISDVMMPQMDGYAFCNFVKNEEEYCHIPVILLTAKTTLEAKITGLEQGADAYIDKPFSTDHLWVQIMNLLMGRIRLQRKYASVPLVGGETIALNRKEKIFIENLNEKIEAHLNEENFSIDVLAEEMNMSRSVFYRKIKGTFDMSPNDYLKICRLKKAASLLQEGELRINEVCEQLGFSSSSYFAKCFRSQFGMTPKEFIQQSESKLI